MDSKWELTLIGVSVSGDIATIQLQTDKKLKLTKQDMKALAKLDGFETVYFGDTHSSPYGGTTTDLFIEYTETTPSAN